MLRHLAVLGLALVAALSWWVSTHESRKATALGVYSDSPDYYMEQFTAVQMDEAGLPKQQLRAGYMAHYQHDGHAELQQPELTLYRPDGPAWAIRAEQGILAGDGATATMRGDVHIDRLGEGAALTVVASDLTLSPEAGYGETAQAVRIYHSGGELSATGMRVDLKNQSIKLLAHVKGRYETKP